MKALFHLLVIVLLFLSGSVVYSQTAPPPPATPEEVIQHFQKARADIDPLKQNYGMMQLAVGLDESLTRQTLDLLKSKKEPSLGMLYCLLISRLVEFNPRASVDYALVVPQDGLKSVTIAAAFTAWAPRDPEASLAFIAKMSTGSSRQYAVASAMNSLLRVDSEKAIRLGHQFLTEQDLAPLSHVISMAAAKSNPKKTAEEALLVKDRNSRANSLYGALREWTGKDRAAALAWAESLPEREDRDDAVGYVVRLWVEKDAPAAARYAVNLPDNESRTPVLSGVISEWCRTDRDAAVAWVTSLPKGKPKANAIEAIIQYWAPKDAQGAAAFALSQPLELLNTNAVMSLLEPLTKIDLNASIDFIQKLPPGDEQDWAIRTVGVKWSEKDPRAAAEFCKVNGSESTILNTMGGITDNWIKKDFSEAKLYMEMLPPGEARVGMLLSLMHHQFQTDPAGAAAYVKSLSEANRRGSAYYVAYTWFKVDPEAAADWTMTLPESKARYLGASQVLTDWTKKDPYKASLWLGKLTTGPDRNRVIYAFARKAAEVDPANAAKWAVTISEPDLKESTLFAVMQTWMRIDSDAAKSWLRGADLPQELKTRLVR